MGLQGKFSWFESLNQGGRKAVSFMLTCDNLFQSETFDCAIVDGAGQLPPQIRRHLKLKPKESFRFDYDTCGWDWCHGDYFAILGRNDQPEQRWDLSLKVYGRGECPECHGTHKCQQCGGNGFVKDLGFHTITSCRVCRGTGVCQTCYVPIRRGTSLAQEVCSGVPAPDVAESRQRKIAALRQTVSDLQSKIEKAEWDVRMMQVKGMDVFSHTAYSAQLELKHQYERQLIHAQYELGQLERLNT